MTTVQVEDVTVTVDHGERYVIVRAAVERGARVELRVTPGDFVRLVSAARAIALLLPAGLLPSEPR